MPLHWKLQEKGLSECYCHDEGTQSFCRRLMALPFLSPEVIPTAFGVLEAECDADELEALYGVLHLF